MIAENIHAVAELYPSRSHRIAQHQETHGECAHADGGNDADRPAVDAAQRSRTDSEADAMTAVVMQ